MGLQHVRERTTGLLFPLAQGQSLLWDFCYLLQDVLLNNTSVYSQWKSLYFDLHKDDHFDHTVCSEEYLWKFLTKITLFWDNPKALWLALSTKMYIISIERKVINRQSKVSYYMYHRYYGRENFTFIEKEYWTKISVNSPLLCINKSTTQIFWLVSNATCKLQINIPIEMTSSHAKLVWYFELYMWHF